MEAIEKHAPVLVTGGSGYIASWIVKFLLEVGYPVRATVRNAQDASKNAHLLRLQEIHPGKLELVNADLLQKSAFDKPMDGCQLVIHAASPFKITGIRNAQKELVEPALQGTRNVLYAANATSSVKRIVLTSSVAAVHGDAIDITRTQHGAFTEADWNTTSSLTHQPYPYSKTVAEREAWEIAGKQSRWQLMVINPGFVLGPALSERTDSTSIDFMRSLLNGKYRFGMPELYFGIVDVRDVAKAHILAGTTPGANGRHLIVAETLNFIEIGRLLKKLFPAYPIPVSGVPKFLLYLFGPLQGFSWKFVAKNVGIPMKVDNSRSKQALGMVYLPIEQTLRDHAAQLIEHGLVTRK